MDKLKWRRPCLVTISRSDSQEQVLATCKDVSLSGPNTANDQCQEFCASRCDIYVVS